MFADSKGHGKQGEGEFPAHPFPTAPALNSVRNLREAEKHGGHRTLGTSFPAGWEVEIPCREETWYEGLH